MSLESQVNPRLLLFTKRVQTCIFIVFRHVRVCSLLSHVSSLCDGSVDVIVAILDGEIQRDSVTVTLSTMNGSVQVCASVLDGALERAVIVTFFTTDGTAASAG